MPIIYIIYNMYIMYYAYRSYRCFNSGISRRYVCPVWSTLQATKTVTF